MESKICVIYQPGGLGDILWVQKIIDVIISEGYIVYYPVGKNIMILFLSISRKII